MTEQTPLFQPTAAEGAAAERAELLRMLDRHAAALDAVDATIERIEAGDYGRCTACGERLDDAVLDDQPTATDCGDEACPRRRAGVVAEAPAPPVAAVPPALP